MGLGTMFKANKAYRAQQKGDTAEAMRLYAECIGDGLVDPRYLLSYAALLIRDGQYQKAKDLLVKYQKAPGMTQENRVTLIVDYAACCYKLGDLDKGVSKLEEIFRKHPSGLVYQTLGYLYVEQYDASRKAAFLAKATEAEELADPAAVLIAREQGEKIPLTPEEKWEAGRQKTLKFNQEAVEYDDEDSICMDNLAQTWYRVMGDKEEARKWFEKAHELKPDQIDTLYFLSRYDLEEGHPEKAAEKLEKMLDGRFSALNYRTKPQIEDEIKALKERS